jgi:hypothetical protein
MLSLGSFFVTRGGVLLSQKGFEKLKIGETIKISTPVSNQTTNGIGFEIIRRYMENLGFEVPRNRVVFVQTDFYHIKNVKNGYDGAWLFFYNFEGVEAKHEDIDLIYIDSTTTNFPNFSALDIFITKKFYRENSQIVSRFLKVVKKSIEFIENNREETIKIYSNFSGEERTPLLEDIVSETSKCFIKDFRSDHSQQLEILDFFKSLKITDLEVEKFREAFLN